MAFPARLFRALLLGFGGLMLAWSHPARASIVTNVSIIDLAFQPQTVNISVNDQVKWTWQASGHSTTSENSLWDSGVHNLGFSYAHTFTSSGSFPYYCSVHFFTGSVTVTNSPPTIALTNPPNGAVLWAPATFTLKATASDADNGVTNVQFFQGTNSLGNVLLAPYLWTRSNLGAGDYTFSAVANDGGGLQATNAIAIHIVQPTAITLGSPWRLSSNSFQFSYSADVGLTYAVLRSADLSNWTGLSTNQAATNLVGYSDMSATNRVEFYRVRLQPNP